MAENKSGGSTGIALIVGGLVVAVAILGYLFFGGDLGGGGDKDVNIKLEAPKTE